MRPGARLDLYHVFPIIPYLKFTRLLKAAGPSEARVLVKKHRRSKSASEVPPDTCRHARSLLSAQGEMKLRLYTSPTLAAMEPQYELAPLQRPSTSHYLSLTSGVPDIHQRPDRAP